MSRELQILLAAGRAIALRKMPYLGARIRGFELREVPGLGTTAATADGSFLFDPVEILTRNAKTVAWAFGHEALHLTFLHFARMAGLETGRANLAGDLAINDMLIAAGLEPPPGRPFAKNFGFSSGLSFEQYYILLEAEGEEGKGSARPDCANGFCGSCAGRAVPGEPPPGTAGRSSAENARINGEVARAIREHKASKDAGSVPAALALWAESVLDPPTIPWEQELARAIRAGAVWRAGAVEHRYDGPSRRQAGLGYGVGRPVLARPRSPVPRVTVAIDTSGSMGKRERAAARAEIGGVLRALQAPIDYLCCDAAVHGGVRPLQNIDRIEMRGGGGTSFLPIFKAIQAKRPRTDILIVETDGYDSGELARLMPEEPAGVRVIWVLIGGDRAPVQWGTAVKVNLRGDAR